MYSGIAAASFDVNHERRLLDDDADPLIRRAL